MVRPTLSRGARVLLGETAAGGPAEGPDEEARRRTDAYAARVGRMRGATMKLGQLLSFADMLPEEKAAPVKKALALLQGNVLPMDAETMRAAVRQALGADAFSAFASFEPEPIAAASIGQVHRATLHDGRPVAVKVQYPGLAAVVDGDLRNGKVLFRMINVMRRTLGGPLGSEMDLEGLFVELAERVREELDYELEAERTQLFANLYGGHPFIRVPAVIADLTTTRVLTTELGQGRRWADAEGADQELRDAWGEAIFRMTMGSLTHHQTQNADPSPENFLYGEDGTVTFVDFGCVKQYKPLLVEQAAAIAAAVMTEDSLALHGAVVNGGFLAAGNSVEPEAVLAWLRPIYEPFATSEPFAFSPGFVSDALRETLQPEGEVAAAVKRMRFPVQFLVLQRVILGMYSVLAGLGARRPWGEIQREFWGLRASVTRYGELESAWHEERAAVER